MEETQSEIGNGKSPRDPGSKMEKPPRADLVYVSVKDIEVEDNVRSGMDEDLLFQLAGSMRAVGLLEPVIVHKAGKGKFVMIAGHRRLAAALKNGDDLIEAKVYDTLDETMVARMRLTENLQREDLNHIDIARQLGKASDAGMTNAEIAAEINTSDDYVRKHLDLLRLTGPVAELVASGRLPVKQAELIARVGDPKKQIQLAERATFLQWNPIRKIWQSREKSINAAGDYVQPMEELRGSVGHIMQGLAAVGWPMGEKFAGKRPCENCPDNTATYADQPALFAGINPRGSAKKGHCTNEACYKAKTVEQNKVREARRKEAEKKLKAKIAKANAAGLDVCEGCGKVAIRTAASQEVFSECFGQKLCPKCLTKAEKRAASVGSGETYDARQKRIATLKKKFPWDADQKFAVALHKYGMELADVIGESLKDFAPPDAEKIILGMVIAVEGSFWLDREAHKLMPTLRELITDGQFSPKALEAIWAKSEASEENEPGIGWEGEVKNVPLPVDQIGYIDSLEVLAGHWGVKDLPECPTMEGIEHAEIIKTILKGKRNDAIAAIAACEDAELLDSIILKGVGTPGKPGFASQYVAAWRIKACGQRVEQLTGKPETEEKEKKPAKKKPKAPKPKPTPTADAAEDLEPDPEEQLGHIDKDTPLGRKFEITKNAVTSLRLTLIKKGRKKYTFSDAHGNQVVEIGIDKWEKEYVPQCTGYTDPQGDFGIISDGPKELALIHIAVADLLTLKHADRIGVKGDWRRSAIRKQIEKLQKAAKDGKENN